MLILYRQQRESFSFNVRNFSGKVSILLITHTTWMRCTKALLVYIKWTDDHSHSHSSWSNFVFCKLNVTRKKSNSKWNVHKVSLVCLMINVVIIFRYSYAPSFYITYTGVFISPYFHSAMIIIKKLFVRTLNIRKFS